MSFWNNHRFWRCKCGVLNGRNQPSCWKCSCSRPKPPIALMKGRWGR